MAVRLVRDAMGTEALPPSLRVARAAGAKAWLATLSLPAPVRSPMAKLLDASATGDVASLRTALSTVTGVTANYLDSAAHLELDRLEQTLAG